MEFPAAQHYLQQATAAALAHQQDPYHWEKFDELFDRVFATPGKEPPSRSSTPLNDGPIGHKPRIVPGAYTSPTLSRTNSSIGGDSGSEVGDHFDQAWDDALKRTRKTVTTTTKRRIIRHTPTPPKLEMPAPLPAPSPVHRIRYPKTPYPRLDSSEESSDADEDDNEVFSTPEDVIPRPKSSDQMLNIPSTGLTPELHSPVRYTGPRAPRVTWRDESEESGWAMATFEMPFGLSKNDIHVTFSNPFGGPRATVSWQHTEIVEIVEAGKLVREKRERKYRRVLPLPNGISFSHVRANLTDGLLTITYPKNPQSVVLNARPIPLLQLTN